MSTSVFDRHNLCDASRPQPPDDPSLHAIKDKDDYRS